MNAQKVNIDFSKERIYAASAFYNLYTILLVIFPIGIAIIFLASKQGSRSPFYPGILMPILFELFLFYMGYTKLNYFIIDQGKITVRNYYNHFKNDIYLLNNIQCVNIKKGRGRGWIYVELIEKDLNSTLIRTDCLCETKLRALRKDLILSGIPVNVIDLYIGRLD